MYIFYYYFLLFFINYFLLFLQDLYLSKEACKESKGNKLMCVSHYVPFHYLRWSSYLISFVDTVILCYFIIHLVILLCCC